MLNDDWMIPLDYIWFHRIQWWKSGLYPKISEVAGSRKSWSDGFSSKWRAKDHWIILDILDAGGKVEKLTCSQNENLFDGAVLEVQFKIMCISINKSCASVRCAAQWATSQGTQAWRLTWNDPYFSQHVHLSWVSLLLQQANWVQKCMFVRFGWTISGSEPSVNFLSSISPRIKPWSGYRAWSPCMTKKTYTVDISRQIHRS